MRKSLDKEIAILMILYSVIIFSPPLCRVSYAQIRIFAEILKISGEIAKLNQLVTLQTTRRSHESGRFSFPRTANKFKENTYSLLKST